jgi:hypothetical protein
VLELPEFLFIEVCMRVITGLLILSAVTGFAWAEEKFPGIETLMSQEEIQASGVGRLTPAEIKALDVWLVHYTARQAAGLSVSNEEVRRVSLEDVETTIVGEFVGWSGKSRFELANGEVWQQRYGKSFKTSLMDPKVVLKRTWAGTYELHVIEAGRSIGVKRLE